MAESVWLDWAVEGQIDRSIIAFARECDPSYEAEYKVLRDGINGWPMVKFFAKKDVIKKIEEYYDGFAG